MTPETKYTLPNLIFTVGFFSLALSEAPAVTWDGSDSSNWEEPSNWVGDIAPVSNDLLEFSGTAIPNQPVANSFADFTSFAGFDFTNVGVIGISDASFILDGNTITLFGDIITSATTTGILEDTILLDLELENDITILAKSGHSLNISGDIGGDFGLTLGDNNNVNDEALVTLSGNNTHLMTDLGRNTDLRIGSDTALGLAATMRRGTSISLADGLDLTVPDGLTVVNGGAPSQMISLNEDGVSAASINASTVITNLNFSQSLIFAVGEEDTLTVDGQLSGESANAANEAEVRKNDAGTLVLTNSANDYVALMRVLGGTLAIGGSGTLGAPSSNLRMNGGSLDLGGTVQTINTLLISNAAPSGDTVFDGSLSATSFDANNATGDAIVSANLIGTGSLTKSGAGIVTLTGTNTYSGSTTSTSGSLVIANPAALPGYDDIGQVIFDGGTIGVQVGAGGWTPAEVDTLINNSTQNSGALGFDTSNGDFTLATAFGDTVLGLTKLGANALTLSGNNSYTGNTSLMEGTLNLGSPTALGSGVSTLIIGNGTEIDNTSGSAITLTNNPTVILPGDGFVYGGTLDLNMGTGPVTLTLPPNNSTRIITLEGTGRTLTFGGDATSPSRGGNTNIQVDGVNNSLVFGSLGLNDSVANRTNTWSGSANVTVLGGVLDGLGGGGQVFRYSGTGIFTIGGVSTYTGSTIVDSGVLALAASAELSNASNVQLNGGTIDLASGVNDTIASLTIIGVNGDLALPFGEYGSTASGATNGTLGIGALDSFLTGPGRFVINENTPFEIWAEGETFANDSNGDGIENAIAWIIGAANPDSEAISLLPLVTGGTGELTMSFTRVNSIAPAALFVELSDDLGSSGSWRRLEIPVATITLGDVTFEVTPNGLSSLVSVSIAVPDAAEGAMFARLIVIEN